jgi:hypothetical protein
MRKNKKRNRKEEEKKKGKGEGSPDLGRKPGSRPITTQTHPRQPLDHAHVPACRQVG